MSFPLNLDDLRSAAYDEEAELLKSQSPPHRRGTDSYPRAESSPNDDDDDEFSDDAEFTSDNNNNDTAILNLDQNNKTRPISSTSSAAAQDPPTERNLPHNNDNNTNHHSPNSGGGGRPSSANPRLQASLQNSQNDSNNSTNLFQQEDYDQTTKTFTIDDFGSQQQQQQQQPQPTRFNNNSNFHHQQQHHVPSGLPPRPQKFGTHANTYPPFLSSSSKPPRPHSNSNSNNTNHSSYHPQEYDQNNNLNTMNENHQNNNNNNNGGLPLDTSARNLNSDEGKAIQLAALELKQIYNELGLLRPDCPTREVERKSKWLVLASHLMAFYQNASPIMEPEEWSTMLDRAEQLRHELERMKKRRTLTVQVCRAIEMREGCLRDLHQIVVVADGALYNSTAKRRKFDRRSASEQLVSDGDRISNEIIRMTQEVLKLLMEWSKTVGSKVIRRQEAALSVSTMVFNTFNNYSHMSPSFVVAADVSDSDSTGSDIDEDDENEQETTTREQRLASRKLAFGRLCELFSFRGVPYLEKIRQDSAFVHQTTSLNAIFTKDAMNKFKQFMTISSSSEQQQQTNEETDVSPALSRITAASSPAAVDVTTHRQDVSVVTTSTLANNNTSSNTTSQSRERRSKKLRRLTRSRLPGDMPLSNSPQHHSATGYRFAETSSSSTSPQRYHHHPPSLSTNQDILAIGGHDENSGNALHIFSTNATPANSLVNRIRGSIHNHGNHHQHQQQQGRNNQNNNGYNNNRNTNRGRSSSKSVICCGFLDEQEYDQESVSEVYSSESRSRSRSPIQTPQQKEGNNNNNNNNVTDSRPKSRRGSGSGGPPPFGGSSSSSNQIHSDPANTSLSKFEEETKQQQQQRKKKNQPKHNKVRESVAFAADAKPLSPIPHSSLPKCAGHGDRHRVTASVGSLGVVLDANASAALFGGEYQQHQHQHSRTPPPHHHHHSPSHINNNRLHSAQSTTSTIPASAPSSPPQKLYGNSDNIDNEDRDHLLDRNIHTTTTASGYQQRLLTPPATSQGRRRRFPMISAQSPSGGGAGGAGSGRSSSAGGASNSNFEDSNNNIRDPSVGSGTHTHPSSAVGRSPLVVKTDGESLSAADELIFKGGNVSFNNYAAGSGRSDGISPPPPPILLDDEQLREHDKSNSLVSPSTTNLILNSASKHKNSDFNNSGSNFYHPDGELLSDGDGDENDKYGEGNRSRAVLRGVRKDRDGLTFYGNSSEAPSKIRSSALKTTASYALALMAENSDKRRQQDLDRQQNDTSFTSDSGAAAAALFATPSASRAQLRDSITKNASTTGKFSQEGDSIRSSVFGGSHHKPVAASHHNNTTTSTNKSQPTATKIHQIVAAEQREKRERERAKHDAAMMRMKHPAFRRNAYSSRHARNAKGPAEYWSSVVVFFVLIKTLASKALKRARSRIAARKISAWFSRISRARYVVRMISDHAWEALLAVRAKHPAWTNSLHLRCAFDHAFAVAHMRAFYIQKAFYRYRLRARFYNTVERVVAGLRLQKFIRSQFQIVYKLRVSLMKRGCARKIQRWWRIFRRWSNPLFRQAVEQQPGEDRGNYKRRIINGATSYTKSRLAVIARYDKEQDKLTYIPHTLATFLETFKLDFEFNDGFTWRFRNYRNHLDGRIFRHLSSKIIIVQRFATAIQGNKRIRMYRLHYQVHRFYATRVIQRRIVPTGRVIKPFLVACHSARLVATKRKIAEATVLLQRVARTWPETRRRVSANHRAVNEGREMLEVFAINTERDEAARRIQHAWRSRTLRRKTKNAQELALINHRIDSSRNNSQILGDPPGSALPSPNSSPRRFNSSVSSSPSLLSSARYNKLEQLSAEDNEKAYAALRLQTAFRMHRANKNYRQARAAWLFIKDEWNEMFAYSAPVMKVQSKFRAILQRNREFAQHRQRRAQTQAALTIQAVWHAAKEVKQEEEQQVYSYDSDDDRSTLRAVSYDGNNDHDDDFEQSSVDEL